VCELKQICAGFSLFVYFCKAVGEFDQEG
jgi:hypothetical protein